MFFSGARGSSGKPGRIESALKAGLEYDGHANPKAPYPNCVEALSGLSAIRPETATLQKNAGTRPTDEERRLAAEVCVSSLGKRPSGVNVRDAAENRAGASDSRSSWAPTSPVWRRWRKTATS